MRSGNWRGFTLALGSTVAVVMLLNLAGGAPAKADGFACTIPDLVPAVDVRTGQPMMAPPIPYGHYVGKNYGDKLSGAVLGLGHGFGLGGTGCSACGGAGCGACGGVAKTGFCLPSFGHSGLCLPSFEHPTLCLPSLPGCGPKVFASKQCLPSTQCAKPSTQCAIPSGQCLDPSCGLFGKHGLPGCCLLGGGIPCLACGGAGCGLCGGLGHGLGGAKGLLGGLLHKDKIKWFVGPGGPVPLTPGYTPYIVTTRSPRDFLSFPPYAP